MNLHSHPELNRNPAFAPTARTGRGVTAVLGPTNTGKTHLAIERMLAQPSGMIGLPLRLLAREVYDRIVPLRGPSVAQAAWRGCDAPPPCACGGHLEYAPRVS